MTGFGTASETVDGCRYVVEIRSVNGRYLKCNIRLPEDFQGIESGLEEIVSSRLDRGTVTVTVRCSGRSSEAAAKIDVARLEAYLEQLLPMTQRHGVVVGVADLLDLPGVMAGEDEEARRAEGAKILGRLVEAACEELDHMRRREGQSLLNDLQSILAEISEGLTVIRERAPGVIADYEDRLKQRMESLLATVGSSAGEEDVLREVAIFAEKSDIAEEVSRLTGHLDQFGELITSTNEDPVGRTLDFLTQEMLREANTIGSKCLDSEVSRRTVLIKGAVDRLKEQVQNIR
ncbi:MAG: YicC family protein [Phycisphaerae bacterium]|nr:YicC family protein [Phycisphaerae bacterium]|tara:strand:+ start:64 stop:933 length:870 start_codon:yes stop_codon:yes gene_type:complete